MRLVTVAPADAAAESTPLLGFMLGSATYSFQGAVAALGGWPRVGAPEASFQDMLSLIDGGESVWEAARGIIQEFSRLKPEQQESAAVVGRLLAPIPRPRKNVVCVGRNYAPEPQPRNGTPEGDPPFFTKPPTAVVGHEARVPYPAPTSQFDYEVELAVVIGRRGRDIRREEAEDYIFGYTIANDLTARDLQKRHQLWFRGKSLDCTLPMGPCIVTRDEMGSVDGIRLETRVNGELRQSGTTAQMIFDVPALLEVMSYGMTVEPGDMLLTGSPGGTGAKTGKFLHPGDRVDLFIEGIGTLTTYIVPTES